MKSFWNRIGWRLTAHLVLLTLGLANIYPFMWMASTSLKTDSEAKIHKTELMPVLKYQLNEGVTAIPKADPSDPASERTAKLLADLLGESQRARSISRTYVPARVSCDEYARRFNLVTESTGSNGKIVRGLDLKTATAELDRLVAGGQLQTARFQTENYKLVLRDLRFAMHTVVSLIVTVAVVAIALLLSSMLGYALARLKFPGKMLVLALLIAGTVAPKDAGYIPVFMMFQSLGAFDSLWGMVLWMSGVSIGNTFLMAGYFLTLPREVEEAAAVDGAGPFRTFFDIALPMARPIVMTVGLFSFLGAWNDFLVPFLCTLSRPEMQPLAVAVVGFRDQNPEMWHLTSAAAAIMVLPVIAIFIVMQRTIVNSIAVGAVKG